MELEFEKKGLGYLKPLLRETQTQEQTQELRLSDGMPDIGRVLGTWGQVILRGKEWRGDTVSAHGGMMVWVLYAPEDGSEPRTLESWVPFQMKYDLEGSYREGDIRVRCLLRSADARSVSARKIMVRCGIGAEAEAFAQDTAQLAVPGQLPQDVQLLRSRYPVRIPKTAGEKTFQLDEELSLPGASPVPERLIAYTLEPRITDGKVIGGKVVFRGAGQLHLVYLSDEGRVASRDFEIPISQFAEAEGELSADAQPDIRMAVTSLEAELTPEGQLRVKCALAAQFTVDDREVLELVEDAYSPLRSLELSRTALELPVLLERKQVSIPVRQTLRQSAAEIADVTYLPDFPRAHRGEGMEWELPGQFQVLFYDAGGLQSASARTEENWQMPAHPDTRVEAAVFPGQQAAAAPGEAIGLTGESILQLSSFSREGIPMVTGLTLGEAREPDRNRPSVILRRAGESRLWDIAKGTGSTVEAIQKANALESEPAPDQILLIPVS